MSSGIVDQVSVHCTLLKTIFSWHDLQVAGSHHISKHASGHSRASHQIQVFVDPSSPLPEAHGWHDISTSALECAAGLLVCAIHPRLGL